MSYLRNPRMRRIVAAMETVKEPLTIEASNNLSMDELNHIPDADETFSLNRIESQPCFETTDLCPVIETCTSSFISVDELTAETSRSLPVLQAQTLPQSVGHVTVDGCNMHPVNDIMDISCLGNYGFPTLTADKEISAPGSSKRERSTSSSSESSSSSSSSSSTSSSSCSTSTSGKDFSPDETDRDPDYVLPTPPRRVSFSPSPQSDHNIQEVPNLSNEVMQENDTNQQTDNNVPIKRRRKGFNNLTKKQEAKRLRNTGQQYTSVSKLKKIVPKKQLGPPCGEKCRLKCSERIKPDEREIIFNDYWKMSDLTRQRDFISKCISVIQPKYQYKVHNSNRGPKHSFSFEINNCKQRVCKIFFKNTLSINNRPIATVIAKKNKSGFVEEEKRGKHGKQNKLSPDVIQGIKDHIDSIPRIESHYLRQQTTREYIDGGKNLTDLFTDYQTGCLNSDVVPAKIHTYRKVFNKDYNISFHIPKKDQCELCTAFKNAGDRNTELQTRYDQHQLEKELCRKEKSNDKIMVQKNYIVACYDLQAVLPLPKGDISTLYYKCKLNVCNFTISELAKDYCDCFVWSEVEALRGANEIATCVLKYLTKRASEVDDNNLEIIFYSDNCCGQQKNQFMFSMYVYAVSVLKIKSITHKFLISGHTQNENDSVHSVIEKAVKKCLRSGPIYTPDQYVTVIRTARKKGNPYKVNEMCFSDFIDIKNLTEVCGGRFSKNTSGETVKLSELKIIKFEKHQDNVSIYYKTSYADTEFKEIQYLKNNRSSRTRTNTSSLQDYQLMPLYQSRLKLSERKSNDLKSLIASNIIPQNYAISYYNNIL